MDVNTAVILGGAAMVVAIVVFIFRYNKKNKVNEAEQVELEPYPEGDIFSDNTAVDEIAESMEEEVVEEEVVVEESAPERIMITINSLNRIKGKTRQWLMDQGLSKEDADAILEDISKPFDATDMDLLSAPFEYTRA